MKFDTLPFRSRLGRRLFLLFILSALVPIVLLFGLTHLQVTDHLEKMGESHLKQLAKTHGLAIYERLLLLKSKIKNIELALEEKHNRKFALNLVSKVENQEERFRAVILRTEDGQTLPLVGKTFAPPPLSSREQHALAHGKTLVVSQATAGGPARIFMLNHISARGNISGLLLGEINRDYLWGLGPHHGWPISTEFSVYDAQGNNLISTFSKGFSPHLQFRDNSLKNDNYPGHIISRWSIFIGSQFFAPDWTVVLAQNRRFFFAPLEFFRRTFPLVVLLSLWVVLLFSLFSIRKNLDPVLNLKEGTERLAQGDFGAIVKVDSRDEFKDLADSFNAMSNQLADQFKVLSTIEVIGRTVLSHHDTGKIVETALRCIDEYRPAPLTGLCLIEENGQARISHIDPKEQGGIVLLSPVQMAEKDLALLNRGSGALTIALPNNTLPCLKELPTEGMTHLTLFPLYIKDHLSAILIRGSHLTEDKEEQHLAQEKRLADQVAIGLSNADLLQKLRRMNWETLETLARTVDAKSPWTAGHSERVAILAERTGREMGLSTDALENLKRAGLLHDIGKIGIAAEILDKPGRLTVEEYDVIKIHPSLGVKVLEPIHAYAPLHPLILHHHEQFDGGGYPAGLAGAEIPLGARILAIADVYDALRSDRPYRVGWELERVIKLIHEEKGKHFDPEVTEIFLSIIGEFNDQERDCNRNAV